MLCFIENRTKIKPKVVTYLFSQLFRTIPTSSKKNCYDFSLQNVKKYKCLLKNF